MSLWDRLLSRFVPLVDHDVSRLDLLDGVGRAEASRSAANLPDFVAGRSAE